MPADVVKLANTHGSGPCAARLVGSNPTIGTKTTILNFEIRILIQYFNIQIFEIDLKLKIENYLL